jgi:hypothetical protein
VTYLDNGEAPPANSQTSSGLTLDDLTKTLKDSFSNFESTLAPRMNEIAEQRAKALIEQEGGRYRREILSEAMKMAHQTSQIEAQHRSLFGESLNLDELTKFANESGRNFASPTEAWNEWTREKRTELEVQRKVDEALKAKMSSQSIPGVTPGAATGARAALKQFGRAVNADGKTRAEVLNEKLAQMERAS